METKTRVSHTPGPWTITPSPIGGVPTVYGDGHIVAAPRFWLGSEDAAEVAANARLIAAAPEMLEALRKVSTCASTPDAAMELVRAAISKAVRR